MKKFTLLLFLFAYLLKNGSSNTALNYKDSLFDIYKSSFTNRLWKMYPEWASSIGYHKYDSILKIPNKTTLNDEF